MPEKSLLTTAFLPKRSRLRCRIVARVSGYGMRHLREMDSFRPVAQVSGPDLRILLQIGRVSFEGDLPRLEDVGAVRDGKSHGGILLDEEDRRPRLVDFLDHPEDLAHQQG